MFEVIALCEDILFPSFRYPDFGTAIAQNLPTQHFRVLMLRNMLPPPTSGVSQPVLAEPDVTFLIEPCWWHSDCSCFSYLLKVIIFIASL